MTFWPEGTKPFSPKFWREVRAEKKRLRRDRLLGHFWLWILSEDIGECFRCGDRTDKLVALDTFSFVADREEFEKEKAWRREEER